MMEHFSRHEFITKKTELEHSSTHKVLSIDAIVCVT